MVKPLRKTVGDILKLFTAKIVVAIIGLFSTAFLVRYFNKFDLAVIPTFQMMGAISPAIFGLGLGPAIIKLVPSLFKKKDLDAFNISKTYLLVSIMGILLFSVGCYLLSSQISNWVFGSLDYTRVVKILSLGFLGVGLFQTNQFLCRAFSRFNELSTSIVVHRVLVICSTVVLSIEFGVIGLAWGLTLSTLLSALFSFYLIKGTLVNIYSARYYSIKNLFLESWAFYIESILMYFRSEGDNLIVASALGTESLSIYFVAKKAFTFLAGFFESLDSVLTSRLATLRMDIDLYRIKSFEIQKVSTFLVLPVVIYASSLMPTFIYALGGTSYSQAILPAIILSMVPFIQNYFGLVYSRAIFVFMDSFKRFQLTLIDALILMVLLLVLGYVSAENGIALARWITPLLVGFYSYSLVNKRLFTLPINSKQVVNVLVVSIIAASPIGVSQVLFGIDLIRLGFSIVVSIILFVILVHWRLSNQC